MIPLRDHNPTSSTPVVTYALIALNVLIFGYMFTMSGQGLEQFIYTYALIPRDITNGQDLFTLMSSMFLHGSIGHIMGNMIFLHIFGDNLEDRLGHLRYLLFYVATGLAASAAQIFIDPSSPIPNLGASGAIAGLMGGYLTLFPNHKVDIALPSSFGLQTTTVPAFTMLGYWIVAQFFSGFGQLAASATDGVAYFAHIGGFVAGVALLLMLRPFLSRSVAS